MLNVSIANATRYVRVSWGFFIHLLILRNYLQIDLLSWKTRQQGTVWMLSDCTVNQSFLFSFCQERVTLKWIRLKCNYIPLAECWINPLCLSLISDSDKSPDMPKRRDRSWTLFLHIWGRPWVWLKVQVTQTVSVLPLWVCLCFPSVFEL